MAREYGQYRKMLLEQQRCQSGHSAANGHTDQTTPWYRIRFYVSLVLFLCYVLLDYTGSSFYDMDSGRILAAIRKDMTEELHMDVMLAQIMEQISITEATTDPDRI